MYVNIYVMKRTTVYLEERTDLSLLQLARQQGRAKAELIREALEIYTQQQKHGQEPVPSWVGMGRSGVPDSAERDEELLGELYEERQARIMADRRAREEETQR